jgi:enoyl-CoA hydratase/carnithine racemase
MGLDIQRSGAVTTLTLDRENALNALDRPLVAAVHASVRELAQDTEVRAVIVTGRGRSFCSGLDLKERTELTPATAYELIRSLTTLQDDLEALPVPVIAAIEGYALGSGLELALACDLRIAAENAQFGLPEVRLGRFPAGGASHRLRRLGAETFAREIVFTGRRFDAVEAFRAGVVTRVVPPGTALEASNEIAATIAANGPLGVRAAKAALALPHSDERAAAARDCAVWALLHETDDYREGVRAFIEKRTPQFRGR